MPSAASKVFVASFSTVEAGCSAWVPVHFLLPEYAQRFPEDESLPFKTSKCSKAINVDVVFVGLNPDQSTPIHSSWAWVYNPAKTRVHLLQGMTLAKIPLTEKRANFEVHRRLSELYRESQAAERHFGILPELRYEGISYPYYNCTSESDYESIPDSELYECISEPIYHCVSEHDYTCILHHGSH